MRKEKLILGNKVFLIITPEYCLWAVKNKLVIIYNNYSKWPKCAMTFLNMRYLTTTLKMSNCIKTGRKKRFFFLFFVAIA